MFESIKGKAVLATLLILLGFSLSMVYVVASGAHGETVNYPVIVKFKEIWVDEEPPLFNMTWEEKVTLMEQARNLALSDSRVKGLVEGKQYHLETNLYVVGCLVYISLEEGEYRILCKWDDWDGKLRSQVIIILAGTSIVNGSGYIVEVNLTDGMIEDIRYFDTKWWR